MENNMNDKDTIDILEIWLVISIVIIILLIGCMFIIKGINDSQKRILFEEIKRYDVENNILTEEMNKLRNKGITERYNNAIDNIIIEIEKLKK